MNIIAKKRVKDNIVSNSFVTKVFKDFKINKELYLIILPVLIYYIVFHYIPMYGASIAFKEYIPNKGIFDSPWVGLKHFIDFFGSYYFWRILKNTLWISLNSLIFGFPAPIIFALLINELKGKFFRNTVQTITYLPHFVSIVVICSLIREFTQDTGVINYFIGFLGFDKVTMLNVPGLFVPVYVFSGIWQEVGWGSIIYLAALSAIDQSLYEASEIDGANRWSQICNITIPCIMPTIVVLLILRLGSLLGVGFEKILLLYSPLTYETSDVISTFVYRKGLQEFNFSYSAAVGLFNSVVNFALLISVNWLSKKVSDNSLW